MRRGDTINDALYNLNSQLAAKKSQRAEKLRQAEEDKIKQAAAKSKNKESTQHTGQKFMKQYAEVLRNMESQEEEWDQTQLVSFDQAGSILATMGFLPENVTPERPDYKLY